MFSIQRKEESALSIEPADELNNESSLCCLAKHALALRLSFVNRIFSRWGHTAIVEIWGDHKSGSSHTCMAMHKDFLSHFIKAIQVLADHEDMLVIGASEVLPEPVKCRNARSLKCFRVIWKADIVSDTITAERVLAGLLQIHNHANFQILHLSNYIELLHQPRAWSLWPN